MNVTVDGLLDLRSKPCKKSRLPAILMFKAYFEAVISDETERDV